MLINLTNHPSKLWNENQLNVAINKYNCIVDFPFPNISPLTSKYNVEQKAKTYLTKCIKLLSKSKDKQNAVHLMGELNFTFALVTLLKHKNINCVASTTKREVIENGNKRVVTFNFVKFREY